MTDHPAEAPDLAAVRRYHHACEPHQSCYPCGTCHYCWEPYPCVPAQLADALAAQAERLARSERERTIYLGELAEITDDLMEYGRDLTADRTATTPVHVRAVLADLAAAQENEVSLLERIDNQRKSIIIYREERDALAERLAREQVEVAALEAEHERSEAYKVQLLTQNVQLQADLAAAQSRAERYWQAIRAAPCRCDPPGSGEELCTGGCEFQVELDQARGQTVRLCTTIETLTTEKIILRGERDQARAEAAALRKVLRELVQAQDAIEYLKERGESVGWMTADSIAGTWNKARAALAASPEQGGGA